MFYLEFKSQLGFSLGTKLSKIWETVLLSLEMVLHGNIDHLN